MRVLLRFDYLDFFYINRNMIHTMKLHIKCYCLSKASDEFFIMFRENWLTTVICVDMK